MITHAPRRRPRVKPAPDYIDDQHAGGLHVRADLVCHPLTLFADGLPFRLLAGRRVPYIDALTAISWLRREARVAHGHEATSLRRRAASIERRLAA